MKNIYVQAFVCLLSLLLAGCVGTGTNASSKPLQYVWGPHSVDNIPGQYTFDIPNSKNNSEKHKSTLDSMIREFQAEQGYDYYVIVDEYIVMPTTGDDRRRYKVQYHKNSEKSGQKNGKSAHDKYPHELEYTPSNHSNDVLSAKKTPDDPIKIRSKELPKDITGETSIQPWPHEPWLAPLHRCWDGGRKTLKSLPKRKL